MKVFLASIFAQLLLNPYVYLRGRQALPPKHIWRISFLLLFILELLLFLAGYFFHKSLPDEAMTFIYNVCGAWYISLLYLSMALGCMEIGRLLCRAFRRRLLWMKERWASVKLTIFFLVAAGTVCLMVNAYRAVMNPIVKHIYINLPKGEGNSRDSLLVVMMSDVHIGEIITKKQVEKYVSMSNSLSPDMVVIVGDVLDYDMHSARKHGVDSVMRRIEAPLGLYAVNGNHEYRANRFDKWRWMRECGISLLMDSVALIDNSFYLVGRDDYINKKRLPVRTLVKDLDRSLPTIMLDHQPVSFVEASMNGIDFAFYGHTHNGQYWPYSLLMRLFFKCSYGPYRRGGSQFYVSSGIGVAGPPYRVGTVSEMIVAHIYFR